MTDKLQNRNIINPLVSGVCLVVLMAAGIQSASAQNQLTNYESWQTSFQAATKLAKTTNRPILLVFNQSDRSVKSRELVNNILQTHEFAEWSTENAVKLEVDFPNSYTLSATARSQNQRLLQRYGNVVTQFPTIVLIHANGELLGTWKYEPISVDRFLDKLDMLLPVRKRAGDLST